MVSFHHPMNLETARTIVFVVLVAVACLVNIPLGALRSRQRKFSLKWFVFIHLSVPLIYLMRTTEDFGSWAILPLIAAAVAGQIIGGSMASRRFPSPDPSPARRTKNSASGTRRPGK